MKRWKQKVKYASGVAAGSAAFLLGTIPAAAATRTPAILVGAVNPVNLIIPGIAVVLGVLVFLYGKFHKRDDD